MMSVDESGAFPKMAVERVTSATPKTSGFARPPDRLEHLHMSMARCSATPSAHVEMHEITRS